MAGAAWSRPFLGYDAETMALAQLGYAVLEVDHRGTTGYGARHLQAARQRFDAIAAEDIVAALDALPPSAGLDTGRAALFGRDYGGYLALRALELYPARFSCAVTIEPVADLVAWLRLRAGGSAYFTTEYNLRQWYFGSDNDRLRALSPDAQSIKAPVLLVANPNSHRNHWSQLSSFRRRLASGVGGQRTHVARGDGGNFGARQRAGATLGTGGGVSGKSLRAALSGCRCRKLRRSAQFGIA